MNAAADAEPLLSVDDLSIEFAGGRIRAVDHLSLSVAAGETLAIVGESGSGKSVTSLSVMRLLPEAGTRYASGRVRFDGRDMLDLGETEMERLRGRDIAMIFQEPMTSLNPLLTVGFQIMEPLRLHKGLSGAAARDRAIELLRLVGIPEPERRLGQYPHQFSGGMRQRVMIAIGISCDPKLIIADEPTTALDVTIQAQILELMKDLTERLGIALILITHNLGIVARYADRIAVMYAGRLVEQADTTTLFANPRHPYTQGLLRSVPRLDLPRPDRLATIEGLPPNLATAPDGCRFAPRCPHALPLCEARPVAERTDVGGLSACHRWRDIASGALARADTDEPLAPHRAPGEVALEVTALTKHFSAGGLGRRRGVVRAVEDVSLSVREGETLGLIGESGCGKSTLGRLILGLEDPTSGSIRYQGHDLADVRGATRRRLRREVQVIFQDPFSSLNPRKTVARIIEEPLRVYGLRKGAAARRERVQELLDLVGLRPEMAERYPHELSGGQRQRVGIARALSMEPKFIVCDEAVSALDVSIQGQIVNLLVRLQQELGLTYLFIGHDLAVVRQIAGEVAVMYLGRMMEQGPRDALFADPLHPYTRLLIDAAPVSDPTVEATREAAIVKGDPPSPVNPPSGCVFHTRCPLADAACKAEVPALREVRPGRHVACLKVGEDV